MTSRLDEFELTTDPAKLTELYARAFNSGDPAVVERFYTEDAVAVWEEGEPLTGDARRAHMAEQLARKPKMTAVARHVYEAGDTTLLVVDWTVDMPGENGEEAEHFEGVGLDVLRRGADGFWRYAIDDPYGES